MSHRENSPQWILHLAEALATAGLLLLPRDALAQGTPNDYGVPLAQTTSDPVFAGNAHDATSSFNARAQKFLENLGCREEPGNDGFNGVTNSTFQGNYQQWGRDALAKLAYQGACESTANVSLNTPAGRATIVVGGLYALGFHPLNQSYYTYPEDVYEGTTVSESCMATFCSVRNGDLDTGFKELIPILYLYKARIGISFSMVLYNTLQPWAGSVPRLNCDEDGASNCQITPPMYDLGIYGDGSFTSSEIAHTLVAESENHSLLILSNQYLIDQLLNQDYGNCDSQEFWLSERFGGSATGSFGAREA
jgi:hypothetical protein